MVRLVLVALLLSTAARAETYTCQTQNPMYDVTVDNRTSEMFVQDDDGFVYAGRAVYSASLADALFSFSLRVPNGPDFRLIVREGFLPNWQFCSDQQCWPCVETRYTVFQ